MRIRAIGVSATLITSAPASANRLAPAISLCVASPFGGWTSTPMTNFFAAIFCASCVGDSDVTASSRFSETSAIITAGRRRSGRSSAARIAAMWLGVAPQHPPTMDAPASTNAAAYSPKYSGVAGYMRRPPIRSGQPALGMAENFASGTAAFIISSMRSTCAGPLEQLTPMMSAPSAASWVATCAGVSPSSVTSSRVNVMLARTGSLLMAFAARTASAVSSRSVIVSTMTRSTPLAMSTAI